MVDTMRRLLLVVAFFLPTTAWAECPAGTQQMVNAAGEKFCISISKDEARPKEASPQSCPAGSARSSEFNGDTVCRRLDSGQQFQNMQVGCPLGTRPAVDRSGNRVCEQS